MIAVAVVLCPPAPDAPGLPAVDDVAAALAAAGVPALAVRIPSDDGPEEPAKARDAHWVGRTAMAVAGSGLPTPLLLVAHGAAGRLLPALGFAQRASRRPVAGYLLVDGVLPEPGRMGDWPDAPVHCVTTPDADDDARASALTARLRGWRVSATDDAAAATIAAAVLLALDPDAAP